MSLIQSLMAHLRFFVLSPCEHYCSVFPYCTRAPKALSIAFTRDTVLLLCGHQKQITNCVIWIYCSKTVVNPNSREDPCDGNWGVVNWPPVGQTNSLSTDIWASNMLAVVDASLSSLSFRIRFCVNFSFNVNTGLSAGRMHQNTLLEIQHVFLVSLHKMEQSTDDPNLLTKKWRISRNDHWCQTVCWRIAQEKKGKEM